MPLVKKNWQVVYGIAAFSASWMYKQMEMVFRKMCSGWCG
jgi:hypothetical protein